MPSNYEKFWENHSFAVVGHKEKKNFPLLTFDGLKKLGKKVFAVDPSVSEIEGEKAYPDLAALPETVDAVILEVPQEETEAWVAKVAEAGIPDLWIHMGRGTPAALALAAEKGINVRHGGCAVMYLTPSLTYHSLHKWIVKLTGKY